MSNTGSGKKKLWQVAGAAAATLLLIVAAVILSQALREMHHEGLTYSQWYEGSIYGYYYALLLMIAAAGIWLAACLHALGVSAIRKVRGEPWRKVLGAMGIFFSCLALGMIVLAVIRHGNIQRAVAENAEGVAGNIRMYGKSLVAALVSVEAAIACLTGWLKNRK